jgi:hypothetical protein
MDGNPVALVDPWGAQSKGPKQNKKTGLYGKGNNRPDKSSSSSNHQFMVGINDLLLPKADNFEAVGWSTPQEPTRELRLNYQQRNDAYGDLDSYPILYPYQSGFHTDQQIDFIDGSRPRVTLIGGNRFKPVIVIQKVYSHISATYRVYNEPPKKVEVNVKFDPINESELYNEDHIPVFSDESQVDLDLRNIAEELINCGKAVEVTANTGFTNYKRWNDEKQLLVERFALKRAKKIVEKLIELGVPENRIRINQNESTYDTNTKAIFKVAH